MNFTRLQQNNMLKKLFSDFKKFELLQHSPFMKPVFISINQKLFSSTKIKLNTIQTNYNLKMNLY